MPALALDPPRRRQIGICGTAPTTLSLAPTDDPAWEFWCCGFPREGFKRCDRYFELHARDTFPKTGPFIDWIERDPEVIAERLTAVVSQIRGRDRSRPVLFENIFNQIHASTQVVALGDTERGQLVTTGLRQLVGHRGVEARLHDAVATRPLPEYLILLGEVLEVQGKRVEAEEQYATVRAIQQLFAANGVDTDLELALFDADRGVDPEATFEKALASYKRRPTVYAADIVAWAAYKVGHLKDARQYMELALSLGTPDPRLAYHAGVISAASGDRASARFYFDRASEQRAALSPLYAESLNAIP